MDKMRCYDPRTGEYELTDNPALVLGRIVWHDGTPAMLSSQWKGIAWLADYCDQMVDAQPKERLALHIRPPTSIHFLEDGNIRIGDGAEIDYQQWLRPIVEGGVRADAKPAASATTDDKDKE